MPTVTCNNNNICDANESCDCADCNEKNRSLWSNTTGEQPHLYKKRYSRKMLYDKFIVFLPVSMAKNSIQSRVNVQTFLEQRILLHDQQNAGLYIRIQDWQVPISSDEASSSYVYDEWKNFPRLWSNKNYQRNEWNNFNLDPVAAIKMPWSTYCCTRYSRVFSPAQLQSEDVATQNATIDGLQSLCLYRYLCTQSTINAGHM